MNTMQQSDLELYRAVVEQGPDALIFADREGTIKLWNARAEALFGYAAGEALLKRSSRGRGLYYRPVSGGILDSR